jgi:hypothetical protein
VSLSGNTVTGNVIEHEAVDIAVRTELSTQIDIHLNDLLGEIGVANQGDGTVNATQNYWGCPKGGPDAPGCSTVSGNVAVASSLSQRFNPGQTGEH